MLAIWEATHLIQNNILLDFEPYISLVASWKLHTSYTVQDTSRHVIYISYSLHINNGCKLSEITDISDPISYWREVILF